MLFYAMQSWPIPILSSKKTLQKPNFQIVQIPKIKFKVFFIIQYMNHLPVWLKFVKVHFLEMEGSNRNPFFYRTKGRISVFYLSVMTTLIKWMTTFICVVLLSIVSSSVENCRQSVLLQLFIFDDILLRLLGLSPISLLTNLKLNETCTWFFSSINIFW